MNERRDSLVASALPASALRDIMGLNDPERGRSGPIVELACPRLCGTTVFALPVKSVGVGYIACAACLGAPALEEAAT